MGAIDFLSRLDEPLSERIFFATCMGCAWESDAYGSPDDCDDECPECGSETQTQSEWS